MYIIWSYTYIYIHTISVPEFLRSFSTCPVRMDSASVRGADVRERSFGTKRGMFAEYSSWKRKMVMSWAKTGWQNRKASVPVLPPPEPPPPKILIARCFVAQLAIPCAVSHMKACLVFNGRKTCAMLTTGDRWFPYIMGQACLRPSSSLLRIKEHDLKT